MKYLFSSLLFLISASTYADQWSGSVKVKEIYTGYAVGYVLFSTTGTMVNTANCSQAHLYAVQADSADVDKILSTLLALKLANQPLKVAVAGSKCGTSAGNKPLVTRLGVI